MTTIGHVFIPLNREHDGTVPADDDEVNFERLPVPLRLWAPFEQCLSKHLSELTEGQIDREEKFWFEAAHVNAMIAVVEAEAVTAAPDLRNWLLSLAAFARLPLIATWVSFLLFLERREMRLGGSACLGIVPTCEAALCRATLNSHCVSPLASSYAAVARAGFPLSHPQSS
jgi:hypothetical protein